MYGLGNASGSLASVRQLWQTLTISLQVDLGSARLGGGGVQRQGLLSPLNWALQVDPRDRTADAAGGARAQP